MKKHEVIESMDAHNFKVRVQDMTRFAERWKKDHENRLKRAKKIDDEHFNNWHRRYPQDSVHRVFVELDRRNADRFKSICDRREALGDAEFFEALRLLEGRINYAWDDGNSIFEDGFQRSMETQRNRMKGVQAAAAKKRNKGAATKAKVYKSLESGKKPGISDRHLRRIIGKRKD